jgi:2-keto-4-pentenoate hydratase/2-oxohepta-3-ene-1,7-dioic acid hydratase in catechol pathway
MEPFSLATIERGGPDEAALVLGERIFPLADLVPDRPDLQGGLSTLLQRWDEIWPVLRLLPQRAAAHGPGLNPTAADLRVLAPIRHPRAMFCALFNYADMLDQLGLPRPSRSEARPYLVPELPSCIVGPDEAILLPDHTERIDWGVGLAVVIGRRCRNAFSRDALDYVAGYTIVNDITARDGARPDWPTLGTDWLLAKGFDTSAPMGPYLLPREFLPDPSNVRLRLWLNGQPRQDGSTASMIFGVEEQIEFLSSFMTLQPGDIIATGTPAGVGLARSEFLHAGDEVVCEIEGIGTLRNPVVGPMPLMPPAFQGTAWA